MNEDTEDVTGEIENYLYHSYCTIRSFAILSVSHKLKITFYGYICLAERNVVLNLQIPLIFLVMKVTIKCQRILIAHTVTEK